MFQAILLKTHIQTRNKGKSQGWGRQRTSVHVWAKSIPSPRCIPASYQILRRRVRNNRLFQYKSSEQSIPYEINRKSTHLPGENLVRGLEKTTVLENYIVSHWPYSVQKLGGGKRSHHYTSSSWETPSDHRWKQAYYRDNKLQTNKCNSINVLHLSCEIKQATTTIYSHIVQNSIILRKMIPHPTHSYDTGGSVH